MSAEDTTSIAEQVNALSAEDRQRHLSSGRCVCGGVLVDYPSQDGILIECENCETVWRED